MAMRKLYSLAVGLLVAPGAKAATVIAVLEMNNFDAAPSRSSESSITRECLRIRKKHLAQIDAVPAGLLRALYCRPPARHQGRWSTSVTPLPNREGAAPRLARCE